MLFTKIETHRQVVSCDQLRMPAGHCAPWRKYVVMCLKKENRSLSLTFERVRPVSGTAQFISISTVVLPNSALGSTSPTPLEGGEARLKSSMYCIIMFHKEPRSADADCHSVLPWMQPQPSPDCDEAFVLNSLWAQPPPAPDPAPAPAPASCFHGWAAPFVVFRALVQADLLCEDAAPDRPWRERGGCAEKKESLQTLCEWSLCSISASTFSEKLHKCSFSAQNLIIENIFHLIHSLTFAVGLWHATTYDDVLRASSRTNSWNIQLARCFNACLWRDSKCNRSWLCFAVISWWDETKE